MYGLPSKLPLQLKSVIAISSLVFSPVKLPQYENSVLPLKGTIPFVNSDNLTVVSPSATLNLKIFPLSPSILAFSSLLVSINVYLPSSLIVAESTVIMPEILNIVMNNIKNAVFNFILTFPSLIFLFRSFF